MIVAEPRLKRDDPPSFDIATGMAPPESGGGDDDDGGGGSGCLWLIVIIIAVCAIGFIVTAMTGGAFNHGQN